MKKQSSEYSAKKLTVCAMLSALGVILLYVGSLLEVLDISMAVIASLMCVVAVIEYGGSAPWMIYGVTAILSVLLTPNKTAAFFYAIFFGFYPILKEKLEKLPRVLCWVLKEIIFNVCLIIAALGLYFLFMSKDNALINPFTIAIGFILCEAVFILYDVALTRLISFYIVNIRKRLKFK